MTEYAYVDGDLVELTPEQETEIRAAQASVSGDPKAGLIAYAADIRWQREVGGVEVAGIPIATDDRSKVMIVGARVAAMADPTWTTTWHGADGNVYQVDATAMVAISNTVEQHVNAGFAMFAAVKAAIEAGTITTVAEVDAAFA